MTPAEKAKITKAKKAFATLQETMEQLAAAEAAVSDLRTKRARLRDRMALPKKKIGCMTFEIRADGQLSRDGEVFRREQALEAAEWIINTYHALDMTKLKVS